MGDATAYTYNMQLNSIPVDMAARFDRNYTDYDPKWPQRRGDLPPSLTLIVRGLSANVTDQILAAALSSFHPIHVRVMYNKTTGEHRGFAFAEFGTLENAIAVVHAFANEPLFLDHRPISFAYTENYRPSRLAHELGVKPAPPRLDWICEQCHVNNFARRLSCFKCAAMKPQNPVEIPQIHYQQPVPPARSFGGYDEVNECEVPSNVLVARMLPSETDEGALQVAFACFSGIQDIRLVRDRLSAQSRGFAFIEFADVESASAVLEVAVAGRILVQDTPIRLAFAREGYHFRVHGNASSSTSQRSNSIAAIALEQAQWALANGYASQQPPTADEAAELQVNATAILCEYIRNMFADDKNVTGEDVCEFLDQAAAAARPHIEEPRKAWPVAFEKEGGGYIFAKEFGLYYDTDSMCYYDPQSKLYYNLYTGRYYRYRDGEDPAFESFIPPIPIDDAIFDGVENKALEATDTKKSKKPVMKLSFAKSLKMQKPNNTFSNNIESVPKALAPSVVAGALNLKRKFAKEIARWSHAQRHCDVGKVEGSDQLEHIIQSKQSNDTIVNVLADVPTEAPICLLCRRKFKTIAQLRKHENLSQLHKDNLVKAKQHKDAIAAQVQLVNDEERKAKKHQSCRSESNTATIAIPKNVSESKTDALESGIGGKMLKMMGWKKGKGLGKDGKGITTAINPTPFSDAQKTAGLGSVTAKAASDVPEATTYREKIQLAARARFEAASREQNR